MAYMKYCPNCQDYYPQPIYPDHMKQHNVGVNSDSTDKHNTHFSKKINEDYMICILHQKKTPCPVKGCGCKPFGMMKKSILLKYVKEGVFISSDMYGKRVEAKIDHTRTVVLMGVPIHLKV
jgi:hypothetical protein